ncbi:sugar-binding transcriptional regulator [Kyrpidia sp.]|uniref:sugar-binding transcriptional regulator n=1 Tax=Kyrpidia sp. TaxID=2073077 RepID=UPI0017F25B31|nr:sugar-binding transcriptional regulator [Kyrpidia sp.]MCL6575000.1 sugar-binding transcriptional regulator [Kyrpidia sp.]HHY66188.1 sugar-binding transcriptional regulator [Alicyclobacillus sp.]
MRKNEGKNATEADLDTLYRIARQYYLENFTQEEIARKEGLSRPYVSRLLQKCRDQGIVQVTLDYPFPTNVELEVELKRQFSLAEAVVAVSGRHEEAGAVISRVGAYYLSTTLNSGDVLGVSWGRALLGIARQLSYRPDKGTDVAQLVGGVVNTEVQTQANELVQTLAQKLGGKPYYLPAPLFTDTPEAAEMLKGEHLVMEGIQRARMSTVALVGIGSAFSNATLLKHARFPDETSRELERLGAVGDICGRWFTSEGVLCPSELDGRTIGITLEELKRIPKVIAVAYGSEKVQAILGALRGGLMDVLITDDRTAAEILAQRRFVLSVNGEGS